MVRRLSFAIALVTFALISGTSGLIVAAGAQDAQAPSATAPARADMPGMMHTMKMHEQMVAQMKADDAKLDAVLKDLGATTGSAKIDALVAAVNEIARQRKTDLAHMREMHEMMAGGCSKMYEISAGSAGHAHDK